MRFRVEISQEAQKQLSKLPRNARDRLSRAIDELEERDDSLWTNVKASRDPSGKAGSENEQVLIG